MDFYSLLSEGSHIPLDLKAVSDCFLSQAAFGQNRIILPYPHSYNKQQEGASFMQPEEKLNFLAEASLKVFHQAEKLERGQLIESNYLYSKNTHYFVDNPWKKVKLNIQSKSINSEKEEDILLEELSQVPKIVSPLSSDSKLKDSKRNQKKYQIYSEDEKNAILHFV